MGLGPQWHCAYANDFDAAKGDAYVANFGDRPDPRDIWDVASADLPGQPDLVWTSPPCQDLSLAGRRSGLDGGRSSAFFGFWRLITGLRAERRAPALIVLENVTGLFTSNGGADFAALCRSMCDGGYRFGAMVLDAAHFLPQSRPRLFVIAVDKSCHLPETCISSVPVRSNAIGVALASLPEDLKSRWIDWAVPQPPTCETALIDLLQDDLPDSAWRSETQTRALIAQMDNANRARLDAALASGSPQVGAIYRRTRTENGEKRQRAEIRFDGRAGCLRTPGGGSSRQFLMMCRNGQARSRLMTPRETARLMGLPDDYALPGTAAAACRLTGDGVVVPVVAWLNQHLLWPLLQANRQDIAA